MLLRTANFEMQLTQLITLRVLRSLPLDQPPPPPPPPIHYGLFLLYCTDLAGVHTTWFHCDVDLVFVSSKLAHFRYRVGQYGQSLDHDDCEFELM